MDKQIVGWWSGGVTSAISCKIVIDLFGLNNCRFIFIDTGNEDGDTYRFKRDCEILYGKEIETITGLGGKFKSIEDVWRHYKTLNSATGAICSSTLKRDVRLKWEKDNYYDHQVFGFDLDESKRAKSMALNHKQAKPIFPLMLFGYSKKDCIQMIQGYGIELPMAYKLGYSNNNCLKTMCIQGGIGYWQKVFVDDFEKFDKMATLEHELTDLKGKPVTMLKDQSNHAKETGYFQVFLRKHPKYPHLKDITEMPKCKVEPLFECNGFCGTNDFSRSKTSQQLNFEYEN